MTKTLTAMVLAAASLNGCSASPPAATARITLFGPEGRHEVWRTSVVDGVHVHPALAEDPCPLSSLTPMMASLSKAVDPQRGEPLGQKMGSVIESMCSQMYGTAYGGSNRQVVILRHFGAEPRTPEEAVILDLPRLNPGETDRLFRASEFQAAYERPPKTVEAVLERGWVRVSRTGSGRTEFDLFLVLKPARPGASYESLQVVTRVEWPPSR